MQDTKIPRKSLSSRRTKVSSANSPRAIRSPSFVGYRPPFHVKISFVPSARLGAANSQENSRRVRVVSGGTYTRAEIHGRRLIPKRDGGSHLARSCLISSLIPINPWASEIRQRTLQPLAGVAGHVRRGVRWRQADAFTARYGEGWQGRRENAPERTRPSFPRHVIPCPFDASDFWGKARQTSPAR